MATSRRNLQCGLGLFVIPGVMLAHDSAKEWIPAFAAVTIFLSVPGFGMLYFLRAAVSRGFRWGKALSLVCAGCLLLSAVLFAWSRSFS